MLQRRRLWIPFPVTILFISICAGGCRKQADVWQDVPGKGPKILASFAPIYCFTKKVAPKAKVHSLLTTTGPHGYRATSNDTIVVAGADVFFAIGLDFDEDIAFKLANSSSRLDHLFRFGHDLKARKKLLPMRKSENPDPHVWLGVPQAKAMVSYIAEVLSKKYPDQKNDFRANAKSYIQELEKLKAYGQKVLAGKKNRKLITMHDSLRYFEATFDLDFQGSIKGTVGDNMSSAEFAKLEDICIKNNVRVITTEPQFSPQQAEALRDNLKAKKHAVTIVEVDPLETANSSDLTDGGHYIATMRKNLEKLAKAFPK